MRLLSKNKFCKAPGAITILCRYCLAYLVEVPNSLTSFDFRDNPLWSAPFWRPLPRPPLASDLLDWAISRIARTFSLALLIMLVWFSISSLAYRSLNSFLLIWFYRESLYLLPFMQTDWPLSIDRVKETPIPICSKSCTSCPLFITWFSYINTAYFLLSSSSANWSSCSLEAFVSRTPIFSLLFSDFARFTVDLLSPPARLVCPGETTPEDTFELKSLAPFFVLC